MCYYRSHMPSHSFGREVASVALRTFAVLLVIALLVTGSSALFNYTSVSDGSCNIAVVPIEGVIMPYGDFVEEDIVTNPYFVRDYLELVKNDYFIEGVMFEINSPGGAPVASENIAEMVAALELPTVGLIGDLGASGAYLIGAATDHLIASRLSAVGSIGVTMSYLENSVQNENDGLTFVELASGKFKEAGNPNKPLTDEERARFEHELKVVHEAFVDQVAHYRETSHADIEAVADGGTFVGQEALDKKLIDGLGGRTAAKQHFAEVLNKPVEDISFCEYTSPLELI